ncbi:hypothetical protein BKA93DRAFT_770338 [Sparassis latifolia]
MRSQSRSHSRWLSSRRLPSKLLIAAMFTVGACKVLRPVCGLFIVQAIVRGGLDHRALRRIPQRAGGGQVLFMLAVVKCSSCGVW